MPPVVAPKLGVVPKPEVPKLVVGPNSPGLAPAVDVPPKIEGV